MGDAAKLTSRGDDHRGGVKKSKKLEPTRKAEKVRCAYCGASGRPVEVSGEWKHSPAPEPGEIATGKLFGVIVHTICSACWKLGRADW